MILKPIPLRVPKIEGESKPQNLPSRQPPGFALTATNSHRSVVCLRHHARKLSGKQSKAQSPLLSSPRHCQCMKIAHANLASPAMDVRHGCRRRRLRERKQVCASWRKGQCCMSRFCSRRYHFSDTGSVCRFAVICTVREIRDGGAVVERPQVAVERRGASYLLSSMEQGAVLAPCNCASGASRFAIMGERGRARMRRA